MSRCITWNTWKADIMRKHTAICLVVGVLAGVGFCMRETLHAMGTQRRMTPNPVVFEVAGNVTVVLRETDAHPTHLPFEVCGQDVTQIPVALPIAFGFDVPIRHVVIGEVLTGMAIGAGVAGNVATVRLTRDPFTPPEPWRVTVVIDLGGVPATGRIAVGPIEAHDVSYRAAPVASPGPMLYGPGCSELLASAWWWQHVLSPPQEG
jgi:hypothetical protein